MRLGKNEKRLLNFLREHHGWQSYKNTCRATRNAVDSLHNKGLIERSTISYQVRIK